MRYIPSLEHRLHAVDEGRRGQPRRLARRRRRRGRTARSRRGDTVKGGTAGFAIADHDSAGNVYVVWADSAELPHVDGVAHRGEARDVQPVDRDAVDGRRPTASRPSTPGFDDAGAGRPRRRAHDGLPVGRRRRRARPRGRRVLRHDVRRRPEHGRLQGRVERLRQPVARTRSTPTRTFSQVQATTHPFHYDSICLNGLGCDLAAPAGDRTLADFFAIAYDPKTDKLSVVFDRDEQEAGRVARPRRDADGRRRRSPARRTAAARSPVATARSCGRRRPIRPVTRCRTTR